MRFSLRFFSLVLAVAGATGCNNQMEGPGPTCGAAGRSGQTDCSGVTTCNAGQYCDDSGFPECVPGCTSDTNCGPNEFCARPVGEAIGACQACPVCGNGACEGGENATSCAADCTGGGPVCGNGACEGGESAASCATDCSVGVVCGNGFCEGGENAANCAIDCSTGVICGNGVCEAGESGVTCPPDCTTAAVCGNGVCEAGESAASCAPDCSTSTCGDGFCQAGESAVGCPSDCDTSLDDCFAECDSYNFFECFEPGGLQACRDSCVAATMAQRDQFNSCAEAISCNMACFSFLP